MKKEIIVLLPVLGLPMLQAELSAKKVDKDRPNIVVILADDLGFGDVSINGSTTIKTPGFDRIAEEGLRFNQGYAASATSTPSRYAMLTGVYPWRANAQVLQGNAPLLIPTDCMTLPKMLKQVGYTTAVVGKWHLGLGDGNVNWNKSIAPGAKEVGFDYSFITAATNDRVPTVYVENGGVVNLDPNDPIEVSYRKNFIGEPTGKTRPDLLKLQPSHGHDNSITNGISRIGYMRGGKSALWVDENMADDFLAQAEKFVSENQKEPFFLYYALHQPHVPRIPHGRFVGKSGMGSRGDAILEADWCVAEFLNHLDSLGLAENTIVIFSSDNGPVLDDGYEDQAIELLGEHKPAGHLRGGKYSSYDAGTHVPFLVRWPAQIKGGRESEALIGQIDIMASLASLVGISIEKKDGEDQSKALFGKDRKKGRSELVLEATGKNIVLRQGEWIYIPPMVHAGYCVSPTEPGRMKTPQLFNIKEDAGQKHNLAKQNSVLVKQLHERLETYK